MGASLVEEAASSPLLGRERELGALDELLRAAGAGTGSSCVVAGPAGIGKTALLAECRRRARRLQLGVLQASGMRLESEYAFGGVRALFAHAVSGGRAPALLQGAAALAAPALGLPLSDPAGDGGLSDPASAAMHGLYWLTANLCEHRPLLLTVDDVHWLDVMSLRFVVYLARRIEDLPAVLLVAARPDAGADQHELLEALRAQPGAQVLTPAALSEAEVRWLIERRGLSGAAPEFISACARVSGGNPYLLEELLDGLCAEGATGTEADAGLVAGVTPEGVVRWMASRLAALGACAQQLAGAVAVLGAGGHLSEATDLAGLDHDSAVRAVDTLIAAHILSAVPPHDFVHPLVHAAAYEGMPPAARGDLHARAARLLAERDAPPPLVAAHLLAAPASREAWVLEALHRAAGAASAAGAPESAARYLERALAGSPSGAARAEFLLELGQAELRAGRLDATQHLREALTLHAEPRRRAEIWLGLGRALHWLGEQSAAEKAFASGLREVPDDAVDLMLELYAWHLEGTARDWHPPASAQALLDELKTASAPGRTRTERRLQAHLAYRLQQTGELPHTRVAALARCALADGGLLADSAGDMGAYSGACTALLSAGDLDGALAAATLAIQRSQAHGSRLEVGWFSMFRGVCNFARGALSDALADLEDGGEAVASGYPNNRVYLGLCLLERGDLGGAERALELGDDPKLQELRAAYIAVLYGRARLRALRGDLRGALEELLACEPVAEAAAAPNPAANEPWRAEAAVVAARLGDLTRARELLERELELTRAFGAPQALAEALRAAGRIESGTVAVERLAEAVAVLEGSGFQLLLAHTLTDHGAALRRGGYRRDAREPLRRGLDLATRCGARVLAQRARAELVAAGARPRRERLSGAESLTASELRVARMAAEGLANREIAQALFVSLRTVETHLTRIYQKLDVESRDGLAAALGS